MSNPNCVPARHGVCDVYESAPAAIRDAMREAECLIQTVGPFRSHSSIYELCSMTEWTATDRGAYHELLKWFDRNCHGCQPCRVVSGLVRTRLKAA